MNKIERTNFSRPHLSESSPSPMPFFSKRETVSNLSDNFRPLNSHLRSSRYQKPGFFTTFLHRVIFFSQYELSFSLQPKVLTVKVFSLLDVAKNAFRKCNVLEVDLCW